VTRLGYRPALDGIRGLAIAAVVSQHAFGIPTAGYLGVDLFFVLSGFLITTLLLEEHAEHGAISLRAFYRRRALRLLPALLVAIGVLLLVELVLAATGRGHLRREAMGALFGVTYLTDLAQLRASTINVTGTLFHLWSLAVEEQFYVLWPVALVLLRVHRRRAQVVLGIALTLTIFQQLRLVAAGAPYQRLAFAPDTRGSSIVIGCLAAFLWTRRRPFAPGAGLGACATILLALMLFPNFVRLEFAGPLVVFAVAAAIVVMRALEPGSDEARLLGFRPLVALGQISYGLYLWHPLVLHALGAPPRGFSLRGVAGVAGAIAVAAVSRRFVELPFLRRKRREVPARWSSRTTLPTDVARPSSSSLSASSSAT
jgi:peptidoglycan/LPS O-acetylase OafA/YrhL